MAGMGAKSKEKLEARIIVTRGNRADLKAEIVVYDPKTGRTLTPQPIAAGPAASEIDKAIMVLKGQLERAGNWVNVLERQR